MVKDHLIRLRKMKDITKMRTTFFSRAYCNRTRGNNLKLKEGRLSLDVRKNFFL